MSQNQDWKSRLGVVFSTNPNFEYQNNSEKPEQDTLPPSQQDLRVQLDRKKRNGKQVTLITGFIGRIEDLEELAKFLKTKCGVGGTAKDNEIIIQGNFVEKIIELLKNKGYKVKRSGG